MSKFGLVLTTVLLTMFQANVYAEELAAPAMQTITRPTLNAGSSVEAGDSRDRPGLIEDLKKEGTTTLKKMEQESLMIGPRQGYVDSMSHKSGVELLNLGLKGQVTLYMTGVAMTEPAVLAGLQSANEYSNQQLQRSIHTYQLVADAAKNTGTPHSRAVLIQLSNCITQKAKENKTHDVAALVDVCQNKAAPVESENKDDELKRENFQTFGLGNIKFK